MVISAVGPTPSLDPWVESLMHTRPRAAPETPATPPSSMRGAIEDMRRRLEDKFGALSYEVELIRATAEHPIVPVAASPAVGAPSFAQSVFPKSRNMTADERREYEAIVFSHGTPTGRRRLRRI